MSRNPTVGIISVSSSCKPFPRRTERALEELKSRGFEIILSDHCLEQEGYRVCSPREIAEDIHAMFLSDQIDIILISTGGIVGNNFLEYINFGLIQKSWKPLCGFSDATPLLLSIYAKTGLTTYHGPTLLPSFGDFGGVNPDTFHSFNEIVINRTQSCEVPICEYIINGTPLWDTEDNEPLPRMQAVARYTIRPGCAHGLLVGGNMQGILSIIGTPFAPRFNDHILFIDESRDSVAEFERGMYQLKQSGILGAISGLIVGRFIESFVHTGGDRRVIERILTETITKNIPIVAEMECSHTRPLFTFPIGKGSTLDASEKGYTLVINE